MTGVVYAVTVGRGQRGSVRRRPRRGVGEFRAPSGFVGGAGLFTFPSTARGRGVPVFVDCRSSVYFRSCKSDGVMNCVVRRVQVIAQAESRTTPEGLALTHRIPHNGDR